MDAHSYLSSTEAELDSAFLGDGKRTSLVGPIVLLVNDDIQGIDAYPSPSPRRNRQMGMFLGWNFSLRSFRCSGMSINISVPIVASTLLWASGTTCAVQGPPIHINRGLDKGKALTSDNNKISRVTPAISRADSSDFLASPCLFSNQLLEFTVRFAEDEFHSGLFAEMASIHTGL